MSPVYPFDDAATARAVVDARGALTGWNEGARQLLGWSAAEVLGRPATFLLAVDGSDEPGRPAEDIWHGTLALRHRDGRTISSWLLAHYRPAPDGGRGDWLLVTPLEDGSRPADDPLMGAALAQAPCATAVYDDRLRLVGVNDAMAAVIGLPLERIRGLRIAEIGGRERSAELEQHMLDVLTSGRAKDVQTYLRTGGEDHAHAWLARLAPLKDAEGRVRGSVSRPTTSPRSTSPVSGSSWSTRRAYASAPPSTSPARPRSWRTSVSRRSPTSSASTCWTPRSTAATTARPS